MATIVSIEEVQKAWADIDRRSQIIGEVLDGAGVLTVGETTDPIQVLGRLCHAPGVTVAELVEAMQDLSRRAGEIAKVINEQWDTTARLGPEPIRVIGGGCGDPTESSS